MNQNDKNQTADISPLDKIKELEQLQIETERKAEIEKKELLLELANRVEVNKRSRQEAAAALLAKDIAERKYIAQQQAEIDGVSNLLSREETDPDRMAKKIFVDRLRHRREASQKLQESKNDNIYFL